MLLKQELKCRGYEMDGGGNWLVDKRESRKNGGAGFRPLLCCVVENLGDDHPNPN